MIHFVGKLQFAAHTFFNPQLTSCQYVRLGVELQSILFWRRIA